MGIVYLINLGKGKALMTGGSHMRKPYKSSKVVELSNQGE